MPRPIGGQRRTGAGTSPRGDAIPHRNRGGGFRARAVALRRASVREEFGMPSAGDDTGVDPAGAAAQRRRSVRSWCARRLTDVLNNVTAALAIRWYVHRVATPGPYCHRLGGQVGPRWAARPWERTTGNTYILSAGRGTRPLLPPRHPRPYVRHRPVVPVPHQLDRNAERCRDLGIGLLLDESSADDLARLL
jgi:hypothetical protein